MSILIDRVRVAGFRGIKNIEVLLPRITVLIGTNNSGKTSLIKSIHLALGDYSRQLSEEDFHIDTDNKRVQEILVDVRIVSINEDGSRAKAFHEDWQAEFGDKIKAEADGSQYVALRTRSKVDAVKGGFNTVRSTLEKWPEASNWQIERIKETKVFKNFSSILFIAVEAQRDIYQELKEKSSWVGKVLSRIEYDDSEIVALELLIKEINEQAVSKSKELTNLKINLERLNQSFEGSGSAEITPFPKKIRDLSKHFSAHFGESSANIFPMEYHGMGTRSWASMLTVGAFTDLMATRHRQETTPFFSIFAAEEPEAHLHPNAQKTLYCQLRESKGQVIVSTHSPYLAAMAAQSELRYLKRSTEGIVVRYLRLKLEDEDRRRLQREVIHSRGEILFSKALVLCEGETEEQALPLLFQKYFGNEPFVMGLSFIGVGGSGKRYLPFLTFARDFDVPVFIFSDGEPEIVSKLKESYEKIYGETDITNCSNITILDGVDFEKYLIASGFQPEIEAAIHETEGNTYIKQWIDKNQGQRSGKKINNTNCTTCNQPIIEYNLQDYSVAESYGEALTKIIAKNKTKYAPLIAKKLCELEPGNLPPKIIDLFQKIKNKLGL